MIQLVFVLSSHLFFIYLSFHLLSDVVQWDKYLKVTADNSIKIRLLIFLLSVVMGYLLSSFFISLYQLGREAFIANL
ncbi:DUF1146 family protein [Streptococcus himalayensis]|uniref:DUF1146 family protein n=1 Tax=Streptococcus himalayensis TaxID=1888195 RepID=UPI0009F30886|nr:DUF1146 family protein [Streptococcus himalayensis]